MNEFDFAGQNVGCYAETGGQRRDLSGQWVSVPKEQIKRDLRLGKIDILVCTDAAGEGLNLQICGVLVNYDLPWNPMKVEQRIGRIDRIGQKYSKIRIYNLAYKKSVEADVYFAAGARIRLFEGIVGKQQPILSRLPKRIVEISLMRPEDQEEARQQFLEEIGQIERESRDAGFDIDAAARMLEPPPMPKAAVPAHEIAFIHDAESDTAKKAFFNAVNTGRVRVLLGSTEKMGAGTNVQRRLVALHHLVMHRFHSCLKLLTDSLQFDIAADMIHQRIKTMGRKQKSVRSQTAARRGRTLAAFDGQNREHLISMVCNQFCKGLRVSQTLASLKREHGIDLRREQPYEILRWAAEDGRLQYLAPLESELSHRILEDHSWLKRARVVRSAEPKDVALQAAYLLAEIIRKCKSPELHVGFAGGGLLAETVHLLTGFLRTPEAMPVKRLIVHALVAAADDPRRSPNSFLQWFLDPDLPFETTFVGLPAPALVRCATLQTLRHLEGVVEAFDRAHEIDIVVTSAGAHWDRGCSALHGLYEQRPENVRVLKEAGCIGDILWQPVNSAGQIELGDGVCAVTVLDLPALRQLIEVGKHVVLVLGPCGSCRGPKHEILDAVLRWEGAITDLVVDSRTGVEFFRSSRREKGAAS